MGFAVTVAAAPEEHERFDPGVQRLVGVAAPPEAGESAFVVVSTQGAGDRAALKSAAAMDARYRAFVGSRRKAETLKRELAVEGVPAEALAAIKAPAGPRHLRHLVGGDRAFDPRRNDRGAAQARAPGGGRCGRINNRKISYSSDLIAPSSR